MCQDVWEILYKLANFAYFATATTAGGRRRGEALGVDGGGHLEVPVRVALRVPESVSSFDFFELKETFKYYCVVR